MGIVAALAVFSRFVRGEKAAAKKLRRRPYRPPVARLGLECLEDRRLLSGLLPELAVASNQNGRIQAFSINSSVIETTSQKTCGGAWNDWSAIGSPNGNTAATEVAAIQGSDGLIYVFAMAGPIYMNKQTAANSNTWAGWNYVGPANSQPAIGKFTVALNAGPGGAIQIFGTAHQQVTTDLLNPSTGTWGTWGNINAGLTGHNFEDIAVTQGSSSLVIAGIDDQAASHVWVASQNTMPPTSFANFTDLGAPDTALQQVQLARNGVNGSLYVVTLGADNSIWYNKQTPPAGSWGTWTSLGNTGVFGVTVQQIVLGQNQDGSLYLFAKGSDNKVYGNKQDSTISGGWAGFVAIGGTSPGAFTDIAVGINGTGDSNQTDPNGLEVFAVVNNKLNSTWTTENNNSWSAWNVDTQTGY